ncbi:MAG TPA: LamG domain-containing protein [Verrucomicrobiae bacterium]|nr:LamG domain-containing protein [Verrucomicrobiae bacterium]
MNIYKALSLWFASTLMLAGSVNATITVVNYWHLGENDPGAVSGGHCFTTVDSVAGHILTNTTAGGFYPVYTNGLSPAAVNAAGSTLGLSYTNGQYGTALVATNLIDNFGIECWVKPANASDDQVIVYNGLRGNGWGLLQGPGQFEVLYGGNIVFGNALFTPGVWVHLALVRNNGAAILYTNGIPAFTNNTSTPLMPAGGFTIGGDAQYGEYFTGLIDEVRVFAFAPGAFSTNDLLSNPANLTVSTTADNGAGSLRQITSIAPKGAHIGFTPALAAQVIQLTGGQIELSNNVTIDASALTNAVQINGNAGSRIFLIDTNISVILNSLILTNGNITGSAGGFNANGGEGDGGCLFNSGTLVLNNSVLTANSCTGGNGQFQNGGESYGGAIYNAATLTISNSTIAGNNGYGGSSYFGACGNSRGGTIYNSGILTINNSALTGNGGAGTATPFGNGSAALGAGIYNDGTLAMNNTTVANNRGSAGSAELSANGGNGFGGGIYNNGAFSGNNDTIANNNTAGGATVFGSPGNSVGGGIYSLNALNLTNSIVCSNTANASPNIFGAYVNANDLVDVDALIAPLANYGGATQTMPPVPGSPAINAGRTTTLLIDQRGLPRSVGVTDIGAVEIQGGETHTIVLNAGDTIPGSLRQTIVLAPLNSTITFAPYLSGQIITLNSQIVLTNSLVILAPTNGIELDGHGVTRIFAATNATITMNALTIANGRETAGGGGGILNYSSTLVLSNCTVTGNVAAETTWGGGGIMNYGGNLILSECTVAANSANNSSGGGGIWSDSGTLVVKQSTVAGNSASSSVLGGGGILVYFGSATMTNSIVGINTATSSQGADISINNNATFTLGGSNLVQTAPYLHTGGTLQGIYLSAAPNLAPLDYYGGATPTMPPLPGSLAIDGCTGGSKFITDQRGLPRVAGPFADIGAVEAGDAIPGVNYTTVTTTNDFLSGLTLAGISLRSAATLVPAGSTVTFDPALAGRTVLLTGGQIVLSNNISINGPTLTNGITISGNHAARIFNISSNGATLTSLTLVNGNGSGTDGGAVYNAGSTTINYCTFTGNSTGSGGAIKNAANTLILNECTFEGNSATSGGGGGIINYGVLYLTSCTLTTNFTGVAGGGIWNDVTGQATLADTIVANNSVSDIFNLGSLMYSGANLVRTAGGNNGNGQTPIIANAQLAPLGYYGGPTPTMPLLPGSPAIDAGDDYLVTVLPDDQRGYPRQVGAHVDIGAVEGVYVATGAGRISAGVKPVDGSVNIGFTNVTDAFFPVWATDDLTLPGNWVEIGYATESPVGSKQYLFNDADAVNHTQRFYRVGSP